MNERPNSGSRTQNICAIGFIGLAILFFVGLANHAFPNDFAGAAWFGCASCFGAGTGFFFGKPILGGVLGFLLALPLGEMVSKMTVGDIRSYHRRIACENQLQSVHGALIKYISLHGDLPRGSDGRPSLDPFDEPGVRKELGLTYAEIRCPGDETGSLYLLNPFLSVHDLESDSVIAAVDRRPVHPGNAVNVLLGNGAVLMMELTIEDEKEWRRLFLAGDKRASPRLKWESTEAQHREATLRGLSAKSGDT